MNLNEVRSVTSDPHVKPLLEKWDRVIRSRKGPKIKNEMIKSQLAVLLENVMNEAERPSKGTLLKEDAGGAAGVAQYTPILIPAIRRSFPNLLAHELVGVQPLSTPTGYAFALRYNYANTASNPAYGVENVARGTVEQYGIGAPQFGSQAIIGDVGFTFTVGQVISATSGGATIATVVYAENNKALVNLTNPANPLSPGQYYIGTTTPNTSFNVDYVMNNEAGYNLIFTNYSGPYGTSAGEALNNLQQMNLTVEKIPIEATTRKLAASYTLELLQDLQSVHGINGEEEFINILAYEITQQQDRELVDAMKNNSTVATPWYYSSTLQLGGTGAVYADGRWELERYRTLYTKILKEANYIAVTSRRGAGNFIIGSVNVITALQNLDNFLYAPVGGDLTMGTGIMKVGTIDGRINVFVDTFAFTDYVLVGYKGVSEFDTGIIFSPYIPLLLQKVVDPNSYQPKLGALSRYAITPHIYGTQIYYRMFSANFAGSQLFGNPL